jgi:imidazolonepropionase-like amidohydrolase
MRNAVSLFAMAALTACTQPAAKPKTVAAKPVAAKTNPDPYPSTYKAYPGVLTNVTIYDGEGGRIDNGSVLFENGKVKSIGGALTDADMPAAANVIDGTGKWVTPGIIDVHSHLGDYPSPSVDANSDGNEATGPVRSEVWAEQASGHKTRGLAARW